MKKEMKYWKRMPNGERSPEFDTVEKLKNWLDIVSMNAQITNEESSIVGSISNDDKIVSLMYQAKEMQKRPNRYPTEWYNEVLTPEGKRITYFLESPIFCNGTSFRSHYVKFDHQWIECDEKEYLEAKRVADEKNELSDWGAIYNEEPESFKVVDKEDELEMFLSGLSTEQSEAFERGFRYDIERLNKFLASNGVCLEAEPVETVIGDRTYRTSYDIPLSQKIDIYIYLSKNS